ncbi:ankyrin repeat-containing domain protein [Coprinopsis sp. MPI-PUGE-AT-0042]|nr:ankyrin repeat-containing domain protein [Coprinopsis sp. MPI-PUGE-AT-0042]
MLAASAGHEGVVTLLLAHPKIQVNVVDDGRWSALMLAANYGHERIVTLLLAHPDIQVNLVNSKGCSALMSAARNGYQGIITFLLARPEIQVNLVEDKEWSALMLGAANGHECVVELLLSRAGIQVNLVDENGWSALMLAAANGQEGVVKLLLVRKEIEVNYVDGRGWSALMLATEGGYEPVVRLLLGVPHLDAATWSMEDGHSAMSIALTNGHTEIVQLLQDFELQQVDGEVGNQEISANDKFRCSYIVRVNFKGRQSCAGSFGFSSTLQPSTSRNLCSWAQTEAFDALFVHVAVCCNMYLALRARVRAESTGGYGLCDKPNQELRNPVGVNSQEAPSETRR